MRGKLAEQNRLNCENVLPSLFRILNRNCCLQLFQLQIDLQMIYSIKWLVVSSIHIIPSSHDTFCSYGLDFRHNLKPQPKFSKVTAGCKSSFSTATVTANHLFMNI